MSEVATTSNAVTDTSKLGRLRRIVAFRNISAIYLFVALFAAFALWEPNVFLTSSVWRSLLDEGALDALVAIALILPLAAGAYDLAIGTEVGLGAILVAWLLSKGEVAEVPAIVLTVLAGAAVGLTSGLLITKAKINSLISTLGMSSVLLAVIAWLSGSEQILNLGKSFSNLAGGQLLGITYPVWMMLVVAVVLSYVLDMTPTGRRVHATGGNPVAARLAGVRTSVVVIASLMACGAIAGFAGLVASANLGTGDPTIGPSYLLPAYAAAFLGSTQFRGGRYNVWGTVIAVYVLDLGVKGLELGGAPVWIPNLFDGVALLLAVGLAGFQGTSRRAGVIKAALRRGGGTPTSESPTSTPPEGSGELGAAAPPSRVP